MKRGITLVAWLTMFGMAQGGSMYLFLRVLHWHFLLSACLAVLLAVTASYSLLKVLGERFPSDRRPPWVP